MVQPSVRGLDSSKVNGAWGSLTHQDHPILEPVQLRLGVALGHTVQIKGFSSQYLQDPWARLHLRGNLNSEDVAARCSPCGVAGCTLIKATVTHLGLHQAQGA